MAHKQFSVSDTNPNQTMGGGGCVCDARHQIDCKPPFIVAYGNDMESALSPHVVACASCVEAWHKALGGEVLSIGERGSVVPGQPVEPTPERPEPPVVESPDPRHDFRDEDTPSI